MDRAEVARRMLDILPDGDQWAKYTLDDGRGRRCLLGARAEVDEVRHIIFTLEVARHYKDDGYLTLLAEIIREQYPELTAFIMEDGMFPAFARIWPGMLVQHFNDHPYTAYPDIRLILEKAAAG